MTNRMSNQDIHDEIILQWHPRFNRYQLDNHDLILISDTEELLLPNKEYLGFSQIDANKSFYDISNSFSDITAGAKFYFHVEQFFKKGLLLDQQKFTFENNSWNNNYKQLPDFPIEHYTESSYSIFSLNTKLTIREQQWVELLKEWHNDIYQLQISTVNYLLLDDFLIDNIDLCDLINKFNNRSTMLIKTTGRSQWLSPLFSQENRDLFSGFIRQLWINRPVRRLLKNYWPKQSHTPPSNINERMITSYQKRYFYRLLSNQYHAQEKNLEIFDLIDNESSRHPLNNYFNSKHCLFEQLNQPIKLNATPIIYSDDGGSRSESVDQTLRKLESLISPITGVLIHLSPIEASQGKSQINRQGITIYRSAFFKTPIQNAQKTLDLQDFVQVSLGKGVSYRQSQVSALGEALERYAAYCQGNEPMIKALPKNLDGPYYTYQQLSPFSAQQYKNFSEILAKSESSSLKQVVMPYTNSQIAWLPAWSLHSKRLLTSQQVWLPLTTVFANTGLPEEQYGQWHSNGCAAGNTLEEAILQALLELIERDAAAIWWYNQVPHSELDKTCVPQEALRVLDESLSAYHNYWMFDISTNLNIPCVVAIAQEKHSGDLTLGFGAHLELAMAAQRALTELCQLIPVREQNKQVFDFDQLTGLDFLYPKNNAMTTSVHSHLLNYIGSTCDLKKDIEYIIQQLEKIDLPAFVVNYSRVELPIKTVKVVVPGLCHIWPQLANERLYITPLSMGWIKDANTEKTINPISLLI